MANPKGEEQRRVLLLCGDYMEDYEAMVPFQALQAFGVSVDAVSPGKKAGDICATAITIKVESTDRAYTQSRGHNFTLNATFDDIEFDKYDGLLIPGRRSPEHLAMNASVVELVRKFSDSRKPIAAICHGQLVLAAAGAVKGRKCTAFPTLKPGLVAAGAHWVEPDTLSVCVVDDNIVTGVTYYGNPEFIRLFLKALGGNISGSERRVLIICGVRLLAKFTGYPGIKAHVVVSGGTFAEANPIDRCVTDGNLVTAAAWNGQPELISQLMTLLDIRVSF
ncbi:hypothetical protein L3X38_015581 [Prunus dulcis]|uniref:DJ-1/PfpI domain-containing protein n=1 Tax=Prunus dulcis TaxID=3755 RepID=A0AAD4W3R3_PRUDU|nr:hypothetical protein L3X38_015581 [Prunus dulcis]